MSRQLSPIASYIHRHNHWIILSGVIAVASFFRFFQISILPPGLHTDEARIGQQALQLLHGHFGALLNITNIGSTLMVLLQAVAIFIFGNTVTGLHITPALLGIASVGTTYLWIRTWFGKRAGLIAAFLMAVSPWAVSMTRSGFKAAPLPLLISLLLWLLSRGFQTTKRKWFIAAGLTIGIGCYSHPAFLSLLMGLGVSALALRIWRKQIFKQWAPLAAISLIIASIIVLPLLVFAATHTSQVRSQMASTKSATIASSKPIDHLLKSSSKTALMYNVKGDDNYLYNYDGQPALNVFVGIMFILGILLCLSAIGRQKYLAMLVLLLAGSAPLLLSNASSPNFAWASGALPISIGLATMGIGYMLDRWYATFPINSAARASGLGIILLLLLLTGFQGYTQYFISWANDAKTYIAYNEDATGIGKFLISKPFRGQRFVLLDDQRSLVPAYLTTGHTSANYTRLDPPAINALRVDGKPKQFLISSAYKDESIRAFKLKFPGGRLSPFDGFDQSELYLVYEVTK